VCGNPIVDETMPSGYARRYAVEGWLIALIFSLRGDMLQF
jgi:hypothetical protein